jgi:hypothetical protein
VNKRNALIGYITFWAGRQMVERIIRRRVKRRITELLGPGERSKLRRRLPLAAAVAALAAAGAVVFTRQRS